MIALFYPFSFPNQKLLGLKTLTIDIIIQSIYVNSISRYLILYAENNAPWQEHEAAYL